MSSQFAFYFVKEFLSSSRQVIRSILRQQTIQRRTMPSSPISPSPSTGHLSKVFVYGTLKRGEPNHSWISDTQNGHSALLGEARTEDKFPLVIASRYNIPYLLDSPGVGQHVLGEVYEVDEKRLENLDILEVHPKYYQRRNISVITKDDHRPVQVIAYILPRFKPFLLDLPFLTSYCSQGDHGLEYNDNHEDSLPGQPDSGGEGECYWTDVQFCF